MTSLVQTPRRLTMQNDELSDRITISRSPIQLTPLKKDRRDLLGSVTRIYKSIALTAAAHDDPEIFASCRRGEQNTALVRGSLVILHTAVLGGELSFIGHNFVQSSFSPLIISGSVLLAVFMGLA